MTGPAPSPASEDVKCIRAIIMRYFGRGDCYQAQTWEEMEPKHHRLADDVLAALSAAREQAREALASMMIRCSVATGHGDTFADHTPTGEDREVRQDDAGKESVFEAEPSQAAVAAVPCAACRAPGYKTWRGDDPKCAFPDGSEFQAEHNWNCGTVNLIRDLIDELTDDSDTRASVWRWDHQTYAAMNIADIELESGSAATLWLSWYENRGATAAMWLLSEYDAPRLPTEADCLAIAAHKAPQGRDQ